MSRTSLAVVLVFLAGCSPRTQPVEVVDDSDADTDDGANDCGDGVVQSGEQCDFGALNAEDGNCLADCQLSPNQEWTVSLQDLPLDLVDAVGVVYDDTPLGTSAWQPADEDLNNDGLPKLELNLPMYDPRDDVEFTLLEIDGFPLDQLSDEDLFGTITLSEIAEISFDARYPSGQSPQFYLYLYTQPDGVDDTGTWYGHRLLSLTHAIGDPPPDTWTRYTLTADNQFLFDDRDLTGGTSAPQPLSALTAGPFDWSSVDSDAPVTTIDYGAEEVQYVSVQTSSGPGTVDFDGAVDRLRVDLVDGRSFQIDLEE